MKKADILAIGVHPDDIELCCGGTILHHLSLGHSVALCDLTRGELGSRGSADIRRKEATEAAKVFGCEDRFNLGLPDGFIKKEREPLLGLMKVIRTVQPKIVLGNAIRDRHPDHGRAADFIQEACFLSGLTKVETSVDGKIQEKWRPQALYHYIQDYYIKPDVVVDITEHFDGKMKAIRSYSSQFFNPKQRGPETPISSEDFLHFIESRAREMGRLIGARYGEGFTVNRPVGVRDLLALR